eukprot:2640844-Prymnesium_polylepis.1
MRDRQRRRYPSAPDAAACSRPLRSSTAWGARKRTLARVNEGSSLTTAPVQEVHGRPFLTYEKEVPRSTRRPRGDVRTPLH